MDSLSRYFQKEIEYLGNIHIPDRLAAASKHVNETKIVILPTDKWDNFGVHEMYSKNSSKILINFLGHSMIFYVAIGL